MTPRAWAAFAAVSILWGIPYLFIKVALQDTSPVFVAWARVTIAVILLVPLAWRLGAFRGLRGRWAGVAGYAACEIAIPFALIPLGERYVSSSLTAILISGVPLGVALLALRFAPGERVTLRRGIGLLVGLTGVVTLMGINVAGRPDELFGAACIMGATLCYAAAPIVVKRSLGGLHPLGTVAASLTLSGVALTPFAIAGRPAALPSTASLAALLVLGVLCTAVALGVYFFLITEAGPSRASIITYLNPAVAVGLGVLVLGESVTPLLGAELLLIVAGSWLATDGRLPPGTARLVGPLLARLRERRRRRLGPPAACSAPR
jgi:drug/metabolite transporter (DMT)-like permease